MYRMANTMTRMTLTLAVLAAFVGNGLAQTTDKLTLKTGVVPLATLLKELSTASGLTLDSIPRFRGEVMLLDVKDAPVNDVLERVAKAVGADWEKIEGGYRLVLSTETERRQREEEIADRASRIQRGLDQRIAAMGPTLDANAARQAVEEALKTQEEFQRRMQQRDQAGGSIFLNANVSRPSARTMPAERTALLLAKAIGERTLAAMMPGDRVVFSTSPTAMQVRMPASTSQTLQEFVQQHNLVADMVRDLGKPTSEGGLQINVMMSGQADLNAKPISRLARVLLVVERFRDSWNIQLRAFDVDGRLAGQAFTMVNAASANDPTPLALKHPEKPFEMPPLSHEFAALLSQPQRGVSFTTGATDVVRTIRIGSADGFMVSGGEPTWAKPVSDEWRARLSRPETFDPLSFVVGEAIGRIAAAESMNVVACLSDQLSAAQASLLRDNLTVGQAAGTLAGVPSVQLSFDGGWMMLRPRHLIEHRATQLDRVALGQALRRGLADGRVSLDLMASYAAAQPSIVAMESYDGEVFAALSKHIVEGATLRDHAFQREMLRLYAHLNPGQRNALAQGNAIQLNALNGSGRAALQRMVFNAMNFMPIQVRTEGQPRDPVRPMTEIERTDALPSGIPNNGYMTLQVNETPAALATNSKTGATRVMSGYELSGMLPDPNGGNRPPSEEFDGYVPMTLRVLQFTFHFSPTTTGDQGLTDKVFPPAGTRPVAFAQLPTAFLARLQEFRNRVGSFQATGAVEVIAIGGTRGGGPPPPSNR